MLIVPFPSLVPRGNALHSLVVVVREVPFLLLLINSALAVLVAERRARVAVTGLHLNMPPKIAVARNYRCCVAVE